MAGQGTFPRKSSRPILDLPTPSSSLPALYCCDAAKRWSHHSSRLLAGITVALVLLLAATCLQLLQGDPWRPLQRQHSSHAISGFRQQWRSLTGWRPNATEFLSQHCTDVRSEFDRLIRQTNLRPWIGKSLDQKDLTAAGQTQLYHVNDTWYLSPEGEPERMLPTYICFMQRLRTRVRLPDLVLPINPADEPVSRIEDPAFVMGFCKDNATNDVLIPNDGNGIVRVKPKMMRRPRAGPNDPRKPAAVWRGSFGGAGGWKKGREAVLNFGVERPDLMDSGMLDWNEEALGPANGRVKPFISFREQVNSYRMQIWATGNCASYRLGAQLATDAVVLKVDSSEMEWYYPLLQPWKHYIPVSFNGTHFGAEQAIAWALAHPQEVADIVKNAMAFADKYLNPNAVDCYVVQLLLAVKQLMAAEVALPSNAVFLKTPYRDQSACSRGAL